jgi:hypothetical protein
MAVRLDKAIKREVDVRGTLYTVTIAPEGVTIVQKGRRKGHFLSWESIASGDAALTEDLRLSLAAYRRDEQ